MNYEQLDQSVVKFGNTWAIPSDTEKTKNGKIKSGKYVESDKECHNDLLN